MRYLASLFLLIAAVVHAQEVGASMSGVVTDATSGTVPAAEVRARHIATGKVQTTRTNGDGIYSFPALDIGEYELTAAKEGFKRAVRTGVQLHLGSRIAIDLELEVGAIAQEVTVAEQAVPLQTESSEKSSLISGEQVRELQLNGRSFLTLLELLPGVTSDLPDRADPNTSANLSINGARSTSSSFNIDGSNNADVIVGSSSMNTFTSVDTIAEVQVVTSTFNAEYGRGGFSQVNVVTRGGTNRFRGSLYHFFRNDALDARDYFTHQRLPLKLNNFGYNFGGPLNPKRDRTFFFAAQEFNYLSTRGEAILTRVPTEAERRGEFGSLSVPADRINANAAKLLSLYPLPNYQGLGNLNYASAAASRQNFREDLIRIDHHITPSLRIYGRYVQDNADIENPYGGSGLTSVTTRFPGLGASVSDRPGRNAVVNLTWAVSPALVNEFSANWAGRRFRMEPVGPNVTRSQLGLTVGELFPDSELNVFPTVNLGSGYAALTVVRRGSKDLFNSEISNNTTWISGKHQWKFGIYGNYGGNREQQFSPNTNGSFTFTTNNTGNPVANLLLGLPATYAELRNLMISRIRFGMLEWFAQDTYRLRPNLTINYGIRYTSMYHPYDREDALTNFLPGAWDPARAPQMNDRTGQRVAGTGDELNGVVLAGNSSPFGRKITRDNHNLWAPRLGIAWSPGKSRRMVIRTGYGQSYTRPLLGAWINNTFDNPPYSGSVTLQNPTFDNPASGIAVAEATPNLNVLGVPMKAPTVHQWSFGVQRQLPMQNVLEVSYVGSKSTHLMRPFNINNPLPGQTLATGLHVNALRPYRGWGNIIVRETNGNANYHSLQVSLNRRVRTLSYGVAYTWAKSIDDASSERGTGDIPPDSRNARLERAVSDFDRTHVLTTNFIYTLPLGFQISGIGRMWSGRPLDITISSDIAGIGNVQNQRPNVNGDPSGLRTVEQWFRTDVFSRPAPGTFGTLGRNALRGPGVHKWDLSLFKNFRFEQGRSIQFRAEAFNVFNHPVYTSVGTALRVTTTGADPNVDNFGVVTGTRDARVMQLALKLYF